MNQWATEAGEYVGSTKQFSQKLDARGFARKRQPKTGRHGFIGLRPLTPELAARWADEPPGP